MNKKAEVKVWLNDYFLYKEYVKGIYLIGSFLSGNILKSNDIDIVVKLNGGSNVLSLISNSFKTARTEFEAEFQKPLHITCFTSGEEELFTSFMLKNKFEKIL